MLFYVKNGLWPWGLFFFFFFFWKMMAGSLQHDSSPMNLSSCYVFFFFFFFFFSAATLWIESPPNTPAASLRGKKQPNFFFFFFFCRCCFVDGEHIQHDGGFSQRKETSNLVFVIKAEGKDQTKWCGFKIVFLRLRVPIWNLLIARFNRFSSD